MPFASSLRREGSRAALSRKAERFHLIGKPVLLFQASAAAVARPELAAMRSVTRAANSPWLPFTHRAVARGRELRVCSIATDAGDESHEIRDTGGGGVRGLGHFERRLGAGPEGDAEAHRHADRLRSRRDLQQLHPDGHRPERIPRQRFVQVRRAGDRPAPDRRVRRRHLSLSTDGFHGREGAGPEHARRRTRRQAARTRWSGASRRAACST